jgi:hypothetical protein
MINTLKVLREAGFFTMYSNLNEEEILDEIYKKRKKAYSEIFNCQYDPGRDLSDRELAKQDYTKFLYLDFEAGVCAQNKVYAQLLEVLDELSGRRNIITNIVEQWESETGPVMVSFKLNGEPKRYEPAYYDDWVDQESLEEVLSDISKVIQQEFHLCIGPNGEWIGQEGNYIRLTDDERKILETKLHWQFFDGFLKEMHAKSEKQ